MAAPERPIVLYDGDCGFCRWATDKLLSWDRRGRIRAAPIQGAEGVRLLGGMADETKLGSWHLVETDGTVRSGGDAVAPLMRRLPGGKPAAALAHLFPTATDSLYRALAERRSWFGRLLGERACAVDPSRGAGESGAEPTTRSRWHCGEPRCTRHASSPA